MTPLAFALFAAAQTVSLTGLWRDDLGREYRVRQVGVQIYWTMDARPEAINSFRGNIEGDVIRGLWADLPGGRGNRVGNLELRIANPGLLMKVGGSAYEAASWRRVRDDAPEQTINPPVAPTPPAPRPAAPATSTPTPTPTDPRPAAPAPPAPASPGERPGSPRSDDREDGRARTGNSESASPRPISPVDTPTTSIQTLPTEYQRSQRIDARAAGSLTLDNGARVEIPAGTFNAATTVTVKKLRLDAPDGKASAIYEIDALGAPLQGDAILTFPLDKAALSKAGRRGRVRVATFTEEAGWTEVPAMIDRAAGTATVRTNHFSTWGVFWPGLWQLEFDPQSPPVHLQVPHYAQGGSGWCWAASTQMLVKYYGRDTDIWKIAETFGSDFEDGLRGGRFLIGYYAGYVEAHGFQVERSLLGWRDYHELSGYLMFQLRLGRPVWLAVSGAEHVVVVVGFDETGFYINDPSGFMKDFISGRSAADETRLNATHLSYEEWNTLLSKNQASIKGLGFNHTLVIIGTPPSRLPAASLTVLADDIAFRIPKPTGATSDFENTFKWDGQKPNGQTFAGLKENFTGLPDNSPGNSDTLVKFLLTLANSETRELTGSVELYLDGKLLREKQNVRLAPETTMIELDLMAGNPYALPRNRLKVGAHQFVALLKVDGRNVDSVTIPFNVGPAQPTGLKAERSGDVVRLTWDQNPEVPNGDDIGYLLWRDSKQLKYSADLSAEDRLTQNDASNHAYQVEAVSIKDLKTNSHISERVLVSAKPKGAALKLDSTGLAPDRRGAPCIVATTNTAEDGCGKGERFRFAVETPPPAAIMPGVPFVIRVGASGTAGSSGLAIDRNLELEISPTPGVSVVQTSRHSPVVGTICSNGGRDCPFKTQGIGEWEITVAADRPPGPLTLTLRLGFGRAAQTRGSLDSWVQYRYSP